MNTVLANAMEIGLVFLLAVGSFFMLLGAFSLVKLSEFFKRLHGPTKATTLGVGSLVVASMIYFSTTGEVGLHELLITLFLFITAPTSASMLAKAAMQVHAARVERTRGEPWEQ